MIEKNSFKDFLASYDAKKCKSQLDSIKRNTKFCERMLENKELMIKNHYNTNLVKKDLEKYMMKVKMYTGYEQYDKEYGDEIISLIDSVLKKCN